MALEPIPHVVADSGDVSAAPSGAIPIALYGGGGGGGAVDSVNGQTGTVALSAADVGALPDTYTPPATTWANVQGKPATFPPVIGTSATTALAGNTVIPAAPTWANISGKPAVVAAGADAAAARTVIGAGTGSSNLTLAQAQAGIATKPAIAALTAIADTSSADAESNAIAINAIIAALKA